MLLALTIIELSGSGNIFLFKCLICGATIWNVGRYLPKEVYRETEGFVATCIHVADHTPMSDDIDWFNHLVVGIQSLLPVIWMSEWLSECGKAA